MTPFLRLIRLPNLLIVALTQYLLQYIILVPELSRLGQPPVLPRFEFSLLVFSTVLIAASGYIINDIEDVEIDRINKPEHKRIVGRVYPLSMSWLFYWTLVILGFGISLYLALFINDFVQLAIYPVAVLLLWAYSRWFKRQFLIGNLVVAAFCGFVAWVVFYAQSLSVLNIRTYSFTTFLNFTENSLLEQSDTVRMAFMGYAVLAFASTLFREIVKDLEDAQGDAAMNCRTLPVVLGVSQGRNIAFLVGSFFLLLVLFFSWILRGSFLKILILNITISLPILYVLFLLWRAQEKKDFARVSKLAKLIMLSGLIFILIMKI